MLARAKRGQILLPKTRGIGRVKVVLMRGHIIPLLLPPSPPVSIHGIFANLFKEETHTADADMHFNRSKRVCRYLSSSDRWFDKQFHLMDRLCAGGIFTFPLLSPALAEHLKLTQPQLTTIVLACVSFRRSFTHD